MLASLLLNLLVARFRRYDPAPAKAGHRRSTPSAHLSTILLGVGRTLMIVGGTVVLFSVILSLAETWGALSFLSELLAPLMSSLGFSPALAPAIVSGILVVTAGCQSAAHSGAPLTQVMMVMALLCGFGSFSIQLQSLSLLPGMSWKPFLLYKTTQALVSLGLTRAFIALFPLSTQVSNPYQYATPGITFGQLATLAGFALVVLLVFYFCVAILLHFAED